MKIKRIHLKEFKRFKDLTISDLPETAKLVILIGPNGCGKSSLFEAMYSKARAWYHNVRYDGYYNRSQEHDSAQVINNNQISFHGNPPATADAWRKAIYVRSAYRNTPSFSNQQIALPGSALEEQRIHRMIDNDQATDKNHVRLYSGIVEAVFEKGKEHRPAKDIQQVVIGEVREFLRNMFPEMILNGLSAPQKSIGTFCFDKGEVSGFRYENLSGGEKAAFDLILDMAIKRKEFNDTVFCIDEPESHVGVRVQGKLLSILYKMVPDNCQLWIATHSIGMMREAYRLQEAKGDEIVFLDFDRRDFDKPQTLSPAKMDRALWERMHDVILGDLAKLVMPDTIYLCESHPHKSFDADCYNHIFATEYPTVKFISLGGKGQLTLMRHLLSTAAPDLQLISLRDGDRSTPSRKQKDSTTNSKVLSRRCIEEYLVDNEVTSLLCKQQQWQTAQEDMNKIAVIREEYIGKPKETAEKILQYLNDTHPEHALGDDTDDFLRNTLAQLIKPGMSVYEELKRDIFGNGAEQ